MTPYYQAIINSTETISHVNTSISKVDNNDAVVVSWKKKVAVVISAAVAVVGGGVGLNSMSIEGKLRAPAMNLVNSRSNSAAIVSSVESKTGGCRTTGSVAQIKGEHIQTFGEPMESLDFTAKSYRRGSYQEKHRFDTLDQAWQGCAKECNWDQRCHTYTVSINENLGMGARNRFSTTCYLHDPYKSNYVLATKYNYDDENCASVIYHVSGVCRTNE